MLVPTFFQSALFPVPPSSRRVDTVDRSSKKLGQKARPKSSAKKPAASCRRTALAVLVRTLVLQRARRSNDRFLVEPLPDEL